MTDLRARFHFHCLPFTRELAVRECLALPIFEDPRTALRRVVDQRACGALIAPAGTGKTTVLRGLVEQLPEARYRVHYVKVTDLSKRDMCREIAVALDAAPAGSYPALVRRLQERFSSLADVDGLRPVLILDEAHDLRPDVLAMLRVLTNFDMDSRLVVSIILAGQLHLRDMLRKETLEDVARRILHYAVLRPLSRPETQRYLEHRCTVAGATTFPFDDSAIDAIFEVGHGNLRATDCLALKALEIANDRERDVIDATFIVEARKLLWP
jgi:general secretion pathway protein A